MTSTSFVFTELANTMKYGGGFLYNLVFTEWRHCVSQNEVWGRGCYITLFSPTEVTAFHRISFPWIWKGVSATSQSGIYTLSYPKRLLCKRPLKAKCKKSTSSLRHVICGKLKRKLRLDWCRWEAHVAVSSNYQIAVTLRHVRYIWLGRCILSTSYVDMNFIGHLLQHAVSTSLPQKNGLWPPGYHDHVQMRD